MKQQGNAVSAGIAIGEVYHYTPFVPSINKTEIAVKDVSAELIKYQTALDAAKTELENIRTKLASSDIEKSKIFAAHINILLDAAMDEDIREKIEEDLLSADWAIQTVYDKYIKIIGKSKDELIRERASDMQDVKNRLLRCFYGVAESNLANLEKPVIIVAHDLHPSDTATLDRQNVQAIVTEVGGATSHSAIIARSYEIPAISGVEKAMELLRPHQTIIVDAVSGMMITDPTPQELQDYKRRKASFATEAAETKQYLHTKPITSDGTYIEVELNVGSASVQELSGSQFTDGVGLFRTEFLYMGKDTLPSEEEQLSVYKKVLMEFDHRPVIIRTLDIGGDKQVDSLDLPVEQNPFLGNRALRLCFDNVDIFKTQLRACLRASVYGNLWLMFPMVGSMDDIARAKAILQEVKDELDTNSIAYSNEMKVGIMIEIPSIALLADLAAQEVDFASIGTNDLTQYTTAVDRMNPAVSKYYQPYSPAMFRLIRYVVEQFNRYGKPISVCGEMGGDQLAAAVLIGMGMRRLSMGLASIAQIKKLIAHITLPQAQMLADTVCQLKTANETEQFLKDKITALFQ